MAQRGFLIGMLVIATVAALGGMSPFFAHSSGVIAVAPASPFASDAGHADESSQETTSVSPSSQPAAPVPRTTASGRIADDPPQSAWESGIAGTKHDFTGEGRVARDLCLPCHTPHITASQAPLRINRPAAGQPLPSYQTPGSDLNSASLLCLSCHDGVIAPDVYASAHGTNWSDQAGTGLAPGRNRLTSHPVGIKYPSAAAKYNSPEAVMADGRIKLPLGRIQCTTCHDPHNTHRHNGLLVISNDRSRLCLSCHRM